MVVAEFLSPYFKHVDQQIHLHGVLTLLTMHICKLFQHFSHVLVIVQFQGTRQLVLAYKFCNEQLPHVPLNGGPILLFGKLAISRVVLLQHVTLQRSKEERSLLELQLPGSKERVGPRPFVKQKLDQVSPNLQLTQELHVV